MTPGLRFAAFVVTMISFIAISPSACAQTVVSPRLTPEEAATAAIYEDVALSKKACDGGNAAGCNNLGTHYDTGDGGVLDQTRASALFKQACDGGSAAGCDNLGNYYSEGKGDLPKDLSRAVALYKQACDGLNADGCNNLGIYYENGDGGLPKTLPRAAALYKKACDGGSTRGCVNLGFLYQNGAGLPKNRDRAMALFQKACDGGDAVGCDNAPKVVVSRDLLEDPSFIEKVARRNGMNSFRFMNQSDSDRYHMMQQYLAEQSRRRSSNRQ